MEACLPFALCVGEERGQKSVECGGCGGRDNGWPKRKHGVDALSRQRGQGISGHSISTARHGLALGAVRLRVRRLPRRGQEPAAQHGADARRARAAQQAAAPEPARAVVAAGCPRARPRARQRPRARERRGGGAGGAGRPERGHGGLGAGVAQPPPGHVAGRRLWAGPGHRVQVGGLRGRRPGEHGQSGRAPARRPHRHPPEEVQLRVERLHPQGHPARQRLCPARPHAQPHPREALLLHPARYVWPSPYNRPR